ncbi:MAG: PEP-CTERM sorting domain-containing protein [Kaiparowitsia implicata GSE-PSE-MK54-09C]|jgi:hypothetical protein|nr:PEP-CTERM sorting domain-containing protein [Kaiparowitsia implicata GSE-PSE-MK54-09C]
MVTRRFSWKSTLLTSTLIAASMVTVASTEALAKGKKDGPAPSNSVEAVVSDLCSTSDVSVTGGIFATACKGSFSGNDTGAESPLQTLLNDGLFEDTVGSGSWNLFGKSDEGGFFADNGSSTGSWSLLGGAKLSGPFVISLKAGNAYSAYLFNNVGEVTAGFFDTVGVSTSGNGTMGRDLSHASLFTFQSETVALPTESQAVPEPFTVMGTVAAAGIGYRLKKSRDCKKA